MKTRKINHEPEQNICNMTKKKNVIILQEGTYRFLTAIIDCLVKLFQNKSRVGKQFVPILTLKDFCH